MITDKDKNPNGEKIKIVIGSVVKSEGIDFKRIRSIHLLEPWLHLNRLEQTVGRGIRFCSHDGLNAEEKNVSLYLHSTILSQDKESIDCYIYRYAENKSINIGKVEDVLKKSAIDRYLFRNKKCYQ